MGRIRLPSCCRCEHSSAVEPLRAAPTDAAVYAAAACVSRHGPAAYRQNTRVRGGRDGPGGRQVLIVSGMTRRFSRACCGFVESRSPAALDFAILEQTFCVKTLYDCAVLLAGWGDAIGARWSISVPC